MQTDIQHHADDDVLEQYAMGTLPEADVEELEEHLLICSTCQSRLEETDSFVQAARSAATVLRNEPPSGWDEFRSSILRFFTFPRPVWAAGLAAVVVLLFWVGRPWQSDDMTAGPPLAVALQTLRGGQTEQVTHAPSGQPLALSMDLEGVPVLDVYRIEIVDAEGDLVWYSDLEPGEGRRTVAMDKPMPAGQYWVRVFDPATQDGLLREFGLQVD